MKVIVRITKNFRSEVKPLLKRYQSLPQDLLGLEKELIQNPKLGTELGKNVYKIRLRIKSKGKGKSGGARVLTLLENTVVAEVEYSEKEIVVNLLSIFDKSDTENISDSELKHLIQLFHSSK